MSVAMLPWQTVMMKNVTPEIQPSTGSGRTPFPHNRESWIMLLPRRDSAMLHLDWPRNASEEFRDAVQVLYTVWGFVAQQTKVQLMTNV